jgi:general stress protein YciG
MDSKLSEQSHAAEGQPRAASRRGFASLSPERRSQIASNGGRALRPELRAFSKNRELAAAAGAKGGAAKRKASTLASTLASTEASDV